MRNQNNLNLTCLSMLPHPTLLRRPPLSRDTGEGMPISPSPRLLRKAVVEGFRQVDLRSFSSGIEAHEHVEALFIAGMSISPVCE